MSTYGEGTYGEGTYGGLSGPAAAATGLALREFAADRARSLMDDMPPYYDRDRFVRAVVDAGANELARIEAFMVRVRLGAQPGKASEAGYRFLALWEVQLGLPVEPVGATLAQRQARVAAKVLGRQGGAGRDWVAAITATLGSSNWTYAEQVPDPNVLTITLPYVPGSPKAQQLKERARALTPAHIEVLVQQGTGFIVGVSRVGDPV